MGLRNEIAQWRAYRRGVVHTTLNPAGPGAVRIHLIPPKYKPFSNSPYVVILNGYYVLPLGYSWSVLLENFILEIDRFDGEPMAEQAIEDVIVRAVESTHRVYPSATRQHIAADLGEMLDVLFDVARGRAPHADIGAVSLREYAQNMAAPHRTDLMVSAMTDERGGWNCNLKCRNCYAAGQPAAAEKELSTAQWKQIIDRCRKAGIPQLIFTGGEPTIRSDLAELIGHAKWFVTRLNTNGVLLTRELCAALRDASLDSIQITLYSSDEAVHNALVGADLPGATGNWQKTVAGLKNALKTGLDVSVNTPLCADNADYEKTLKFLQALGVRYVSCSGLIETGGAKENLDKRLSAEKLLDILKNAAAYCEQTGMELSFTSPGQLDPNDVFALGLAAPACGACLSNMAVAPNGGVVPCQSWLGEGYALGNMLTDSWASIWNNDICKNIRAMDEAEAMLCPLRAQRLDKQAGC